MWNLQQMQLGDEVGQNLNIQIKAILMNEASKAKGKDKKSAFSYWNKYLILILFSFEYILYFYLFILYNNILLFTV